MACQSSSLGVRRPARRLGLRQLSIGSGPAVGAWDRRRAAIACGRRRLCVPPLSPRLAGRLRVDARWREADRSRPSSTRGATMPLCFSPAMKVVVFQCPWARRRPDARRTAAAVAPPLSVAVPVSSRNTNRAASMKRCQAATTALRAMSAGPARRSQLFYASGRSGAACWIVGAPDEPAALQLAELGSVMSGSPHQPFRSASSRAAVDAAVAAARLPSRAPLHQLDRATADATRAPAIELPCSPRADRTQSDRPCTSRCLNRHCRITVSFT